MAATDASHTDVLRAQNEEVGKIFNVEHEAKATGSVVVEDPYPALHRLLKAGSVQRGTLAELMGYPVESGGPFHSATENTFSVFSFRAVTKVLANNTTFSSKAYYSFNFPQLMGDTILNKGGQEHLSYRGALQPFFTPRAAASWWDEKVVAETVDELVGQLVGTGSADLFLKLCARMPVHVISVGFGLDVADILPFRIAVTGINDELASAAERAEHLANTTRILQRTIDQRRKLPRDDMISKLIATEITTPDGTKRPMTDEEMIAHCRLIVLAGGGTTWRQLGITLFALLENPEQLDALRKDRALLPAAILEAARWNPTDMVFPRRVENDVELDGVAIPKGALIHMCLSSASRDPDRWEDPDRFDIYRAYQPALAFGGGVHSCLGQNLSRHEMQAALNAVLDRLPNLRWDPDAPRARLTGGFFSRGPNALPVLFD